MTTSVREATINSLNAPQQMLQGSRQERGTGNRSESSRSVFHWDCPLARAAFIFICDFQQCSAVSGMHHCLLQVSLERHGRIALQEIERINFNYFRSHGVSSCSYIRQFKTTALVGCHYRHTSFLS